MRLDETIVDLMEINSYPDSKTPEYLNARKKYGLFHAEEAFPLHKSFSILSRDGRYAICRTDKKITTPFIYDDVLAMYYENLVLTVIRPDGSIRYAIAPAGYDGIVTDAEFIDVDAYGYSRLLATDENGIQYIVFYDGGIKRVTPLSSF